MNHLRVLAVALFAAMTLAMVVAPAAASDGKTTTAANSGTAAGNEAVSDPVVVGAALDSIIIENYGVNGKLLSRRTIDGAAMLSRGSGSGGTSTASGCNKVTVRNRAETLLEYTAYRFNTWTYWCWNRQNRTISNVRTGWYLSDVDSQFIWREMLIDNTHYFAWYSGYSTSGYKHEKQGRIENCLLHYGCIGNTYPRNILYSYSNGTWSWYTYD